jgi:hypothetical protein
MMFGPLVYLYISDDVIIHLLTSLVKWYIMTSADTLLARKGESVDKKPKKSAGRFPLRLPDDVDAEIRALAQGDGRRPPAGINDTILFLIKEGLKAVKESKPGQFPPALMTS